MINWGIIGLGNMANRFASSIKQVDNAKLLGIASTNTSRLKNFGDKYNIEKKYQFNYYEEILNNKDISSIYISTLNNSHAEIIKKSIESGKNILCEKPATTIYSEIEKIFHMLNKSDIFFLEAIAYRTHPQTKLVIKKIMDGEIGEVLSIDSTFGFNIKKINPNSRLFNKKLGGGAILDVGCYPVSFASLIGNLHVNKKFEDPDVVEVSGSICETGVDEYAHATLKFKSGLIAKIGAGIRLKMNNQTFIKGSKGSILLNQPWLPENKSIVEVKIGNRYYKNFVNSDIDVFANQINIASKCILENKKQVDFPGVSWQETLGNMKVLDIWINQLTKK